MRNNIRKKKGRRERKTNSEGYRGSSFGLKRERFQLKENKESEKAINLSIFLKLIGIRLQTCNKEKRMLK